MTFVQITFGSTINRQVRNIISWVKSEIMVIYYIQTFRGAFYPNNDDLNCVVDTKPQSSTLSTEDFGQRTENRTDKDKLKTRREIESALHPQSTEPGGCIPEVNNNLCISKQRMSFINVVRTF